MSQQVLADLAGVTQGYISHLEAGKRPLERRSTQVAIAKALNISVAQLIGSPTDREDPLLDRAVEHVPAVRQVIVEASAGAVGPPSRERDTLAAAAREVTHLRSVADYAGMAPLLPGLLRDLCGHGVAMTPQLIEVVDGGVYALKALGYHDLAHSLIGMALPTALEYEVPAWIGQAGTRGSSPWGRSQPHWVSRSRQKPPTNCKAPPIRTPSRCTATCT